MSSQNITPEWLDTTLYPFKSQFIQLKQGRMHYIDEGEGPVLLFIHGTPTWSFLYRDFIKELSGDYRCIAVDHLGFGLSDKPKDFSGTPQDHTQNLSELIRKLDLKEITLIVHDFGGPIGIAAGIEHHKKIRNVILFNSWLWETKNNPEAMKIDKIVRTWLGKFLYLNLNFSPKYLIPQAFSDKSKLQKNVHKHYTRPFPTRKSRVHLHHIALALVGASDWYDSQWKNLDPLLNKNWLILWGAKDNFITTSYLEKWRKKLPDAVVRELDAGHFVQEEATNQAIAEIRKFMAS